MNYYKQGVVGSSFVAFIKIARISKQLKQLDEKIAFERFWRIAVLPEYFPYFSSLSLHSPDPLSLSFTQINHKKPFDGVKTAATIFAVGELMEFFLPR